MPKNQQIKSFRHKLTKPLQANYLLFLPQDYTRTGTKRWPMILFLHGAGERGTNLNKVAVHGPPKVVKNATPMSMPMRIAGRASTDGGTSGTRPDRSVRR